MVRHHPDWTDTEDGYRNGDAIIAVYPAQARYNDRVQGLTTGVPEAEANCYSVHLITDAGTVSETHDAIVQFEDPTDAWEFANILTHYFATDAVELFTRKGLFTGADPDAGDPLNEIITDTAPVEVFESLLGYYPIPDGMDDVLETAHQSA